MSNDRQESLRNFLEVLEEADLVGEDCPPIDDDDSDTITYIPPINPNIVPQTKARLELISRDLNTMVTWLEKEMSSISSKTVECVDVHSAYVDDVCLSADELIKSTYSLMSKTSDMQRHLTKVEVMSSHLKSINKYLERLDSTLLKPPSK